MKAEIQALIDDLRRRGYQAEPYDLTLRLIDNHSEYLPLLVESALEQLPAAGPFFADAISFLPESELTRLADRAVTLLSIHPDSKRETAEAFIAHCSLQKVEALHPLLAAIWQQHPNAESFYDVWPWRGCNDSEVHRLCQLVEENSPAAGRARDTLLATRHPEALQFCRQRPETKPWHLLAVGFTPELRQLYADDVWHLVFPNSYWGSEPPPHLVKRHPTWTGSSAAKVWFGGSGTHTCAACGLPGHRLFSLQETIPPLPPGPLRLETCLSCLGWEVPSLYYDHQTDGAISPTGYAGERIVPQFPSGPLAEAEVGLARTSARWCWQDWALGNGRQNLNRVGGHPSWIQDADYLNCPHCQDPMQFLFQLDSNLPLLHGGEHLWGSGGILYGHWCDHCRVSGYLWQCT